MKKSMFEFKNDYLACSIGPKITFPILNEIAWVCKARKADEPGRYKINHLLIDRDFMVATDGHRMHLVDNSDCMPALDPGLWEVIKHTKSELIVRKTDHAPAEFPRYQNLLDKFSHAGKRVNTSVFGLNGNGLSHFAYDVFTGLHLRLNLKYLEDAIMGDDPMIVEEQEDCVIVCDKYFKKMAVIMAMRAREEV